MPISHPLDALVSKLKSAKKILLTTHVRPDGDALGTVAAMSLALRALGMQTEILLLSHLPTKYGFVLNEPGLAHYDAEKGWPAGLDLNAFDTLLVCDTGTWSQLPGMKERVEAFGGQKLVLDHHLTQENWADLKLVDTAAAAAGEIAAEVIEALGVAIDAAIAQALYVAVVSDTGWFEFSNTRPQTHRLAARLMETGIDTDRLYQRLNQNERAARLRLQARAMQSLELLAGDRVAVMSVGKDDFAAAGARVTDTENMVNVPLMVGSVGVSVLITDDPDSGGIVRVSFRSKGQIDCAAFAQQFGGGGHARAAGAKIKGTLAEVRTTLKNKLAAALG
jgi:phosphoesterase RecJ-like protein